MKLTPILILAGAFFGASIAFAGPKNPLKDCDEVSAEAAELAAADPSTAEDVTRKAVTDRPDCACGIVKEVITGAELVNDSDAVVSVVRGAIDAAGDQVKLIVECAIVVSPDSTNALIAFIDATYGPGTAAQLGLVARILVTNHTTGAGNNFVIPPAFESTPPDEETPDTPDKDKKKPKKPKVPPTATPGDPGP